MNVVNIGVAASSESSNKKVARGFVSSLRGDVRLFLGGYWGLMKDVADAASESGFTVVFLLPMEPKQTPPRRPEFIAVDTGVEYRARSVFICRSCDVLVVLGGEAGTIIETYMAYAMGKPVVVLTGTGKSSDKLHLMGEHLDNRRTSVIHYVDNPVHAAELALSLAKTHVDGGDINTYG
ncbi:MAG: LOG family protein [Thermoprotei archaeon]